MCFTTRGTHDAVYNSRPGQRLGGDCQVWLFALPARQLVETKLADVASGFISFHSRGSIRGYSVAKELDAVATMIARAIVPNLTGRAARPTHVPRSALRPSVRIEDF
jgi:hypothetical protein